MLYLNHSRFLLKAIGINNPQNVKIRGEKAKKRTYYTKPTSSHICDKLCVMVMSVNIEIKEWNGNSWNTDVGKYGQSVFVCCKNVMYQKANILIYLLFCGVSLQYFTQWTWWLVYTLIYYRNYIFHRTDKVYNITHGSLLKVIKAIYLMVMSRYSNF